MTDAQVSTAFGATAEAIQGDLLRFLAEKIKITVEPDADLVESGLVSSTFTVQLVVHLETSCDIAVIGPHLKQALSIPSLFDFSPTVVTVDSTW